MTVSHHVSALSPCVLTLPSLEVLPCRINNLTMDSSTEYGHVRPSPVVPLGVEGAQQSALEEAFGPVPPPYVSEAEALLDTGIKTMEVRLIRKDSRRTVLSLVETRFNMRCSQPVVSPCFLSFAPPLKFSLELEIERRGTGHNTCVCFLLLAMLSRNGPPPVVETGPNNSAQDNLGNMLLISQP